MNIGIFYGSSSGNTEEAAEKIRQGLSLPEENIHDISETEADPFDHYDVIT
ncbi:TPA: flavodoxin, partial [Candidatus Marinimicrobia bacterium]|nr:flavodoxin [Candidatus Neomarinimicrobiota bacterium]